MRFLPASAAVLATVAVLATGTGCSSDAAPSVQTYNMGEKVQLGRLIYNVFDSQWLTQLGHGPSARIPGQRFFLIRLSVVNSGSSDASIPTMSVIDEDGNRYTELSSGDQVPQWLGLLRHVEPAGSLEGNVAFDAPPRRYKLRLFDEREQKSALIDIPLSFGAETPELSTPQKELK